MDERTRRYYLDTMGIQCWESIQGNTEAADPVYTDSGVILTEDAASVLHQLEKQAQQCDQCKLHMTRNQAIMGRGSLAPRLMFVLLSPDANDDESGVLCSGEANALFTKMLAAINTAIDDVYITSLLKCHVPANHTVSTAEIRLCNDFLKRQVALLQPRLLVVLGDVAARSLLQQDVPLDKLREVINSRTYAGVCENAAGSCERFESVPLFISYSPRELIHEPGYKRKAWQDLQQIQKMMETF